MSKGSKYLSAAAAGASSPVQSGPMVNGKNQNDYPATERPCFAHGCPNLGTITESVTHSMAATWFCRFHSGRDPKDFGAITRAIKMGRNPIMAREEA